MRSLLDRQGTATALVLLCLLLTHERSLDPHYPARDAEPSSPMGSHRGRRNRSTRNLILHAASLPADVHSRGFLQCWLCWRGKDLQLKLPRWQRPHCRCNYKAEILFPATFGVGFFIVLLWFLPH